MAARRSGGSGRPRPARRQTPAQLARLRLSNIRRENEEFAAMLRREIALNIQDFAVRSMNSLVAVGPLWSGQFSASWRFIPEGGNPGGPGEEGREYRYTKNDVNIRMVEKYMKAGNTRFQIVNTSPRANIAIDAEIGVLKRDLAELRGWPEPFAEKPRLKLGDERNNPGLRYEIGAPFAGSFEDAPASMTAEPDWYLTYLFGGGLQKDLTMGFSRNYSVGFRSSF